MSIRFGFFWLHPRYNIDYHDSAVLKEILSGEATEVVVEKIHELLTKLGEAVRNNDIPIDDYIIFKVSLDHEKFSHLISLTTISKKASW